MRKTTFLVFLIYFVLSLVAFRGFLFQPGVIGHHWDWNIPESAHHLAQLAYQSLYLWVPQGLGYYWSYAANVLPVNFFYGFLGWVGVSGALFSKVLVVFTTTLAGVFMYLLICEFLVRRKSNAIQEEKEILASAFIGGLTYAFSPYIFNMLIGGALMVGGGYLAAPLFFVFYLRSIRKGRLDYKNIVLSALVGFVLAQHRTFFLTVFSLVVFWVLFSKAKLRRIQAILAIILVLLALSSVWCLPVFLTAKTIFVHSSAISGGSEVVRAWVRHSPTLREAWIRSGYWVDFFQQSVPDWLKPVWFLSAFCVAGFSLTVIFTRRLKDRKVFFLLISLILSLFLAKTGKPPFGLINIWLYQYFFPMRMFRSPQTLSFAPNFVFSLLLGISGYFLIQRMNLKYKRYKKSLKVLLVILVFIYISPFLLSGNLGEAVDVFQRDQAFYWVEEFLKKEAKNDIRIAYVPLSHSVRYLETPSQRSSGTSTGGDPIVFFGLKPSIFDDATPGPAGKFQIKIPELLYRGKPEFKNLLRLANVNYIILRRDVLPNWGDYARDFSYSRVHFLFQRDPKIDLVNQFEYISLWKLKTNEQDGSFLPHFYIPQNIVYSTGDIESLVDMMSFDDWEIRSGVYLAGEQPEINRNRQSGTAKQMEINRNTVAEGDRNMHPSDAELRDREIWERANEVLVVANLESAVDKDYFEKKESFKKSVPFPYVKHRPGSLGWRVAKLKERYYEWKVRKDPEKLIDKKLFYAGKRISEVEKFGGNTVETDRNMIEIYRREMKEVIEEIKKLRNWEIGKFDEQVIKLRAYWERHKEKIEEIYRNMPPAEAKYIEIHRNWEKVFGELDEKIGELEKRFDLRNLEYSFEIPRREEYEIYTKTLAPSELKYIEIDGRMLAGERNMASGEPKYAASPRDTIEVDGNTVEIDGNMMEMDRDKVETNGGWRKLGEKEFEGGEHKLVLHLSEPENLVSGQWQRWEKLKVAEEGVAFSPQGFFPKAQDLVFQEIKNWQINQLYFLSFDYKTEGGSLGVGILEDKLETGEINGLADYKKKTKKILEKVLRNQEIKKLGNWEVEWRRFETVLKTDRDTLGARIYFYALADPGQFAKVEFRNLKIYRIVQPKIILRNKIKTNSSLARGIDGNLLAGTSEIKKLPRITFVKINPTKYRVKVEGASEPYTLVFSESFHQGWEIYLKEAPNNKFQITNKSQITNSKLQAWRNWVMGMIGRMVSRMTDLFLNNQGYGKEVASYFDGQIKEGTHRMTFLEPATFETWGKRPIAEDRHYLVNGYANSWYITPKDVGGRKDYELIVEFWPQKLFYIGLFISLPTLVGCVGYLGYEFVGKKLASRN